MEIVYHRWEIYVYDYTKVIVMTEINDRNKQMENEIE